MGGVPKRRGGRSANVKARANELPAGEVPARLHRNKVVGSTLGLHLARTRGTFGRSNPQASYRRDGPDRRAGPTPGWVADYRDHPGSTRRRRGGPEANVVAPRCDTRHKNDAAAPKLRVRPCSRRRVSTTGSYIQPYSQFFRAKDQFFWARLSSFAIPEARRARMLSASGWVEARLRSSSSRLTRSRGSSPSRIN